ncbi:hypothetical protein [Bosea sp. (in: a-proteobacteria)]|uniref:hypothetical protein n=1 Tax=Bosea sp. (in: a-proteobacteria) TaxID=1871050 RepID=UPI002733E904|nr:hypothetical protein [Bosea sp. (in: a-proteobacteria)]MDP3409943.1 hypothetical protein [Bosea sp. (in: a-proteobacteria)]
MDAGWRFVKNHAPEPREDQFATRGERPPRRESAVAARGLLSYNPVMTRMLTVILGLLTLSGCVTPRTNADQGLCESETGRNGKIRIICH